MLARASRLLSIPMAVRLALVSVCVFAQQASPSVVIAASEVTLAPGGAGVLRLTLSSNEAGVSGIQFDLSFDSTAIDVRPRLTAIAATKKLYSNDVDGARRAVIIGLNQDRIPDGAVVELDISVRSATVASVHPIGILNPVATDAEGTAVPVIARAGTVTITTGPPLRIEAVRNAASLGVGPVSPGELISIMGEGFGPWSTVSIDGTRAPILHIAPEQINAAVPFSLGTSGQARVLVESASARAGFDVLVGQAAPGIFTVNGSGTGQGAILNPDMTPNSIENPAASGDIVAMYVTGVGQTDPPGQDGNFDQTLGLRPLLPVRAEIGGQEASIQYAGPAPGLISGVFQINVKVPDLIPVERVASVSIFADGMKSQDGVTLSIR